MTQELAVTGVGRMVRRRLSPDERKEEFVEAAVNLAESDGWRNVSQVYVARKIGCRPSLLYHYWPGGVEVFREEIMKVAIRRKILSVIAQGLCAESDAAMAAPLELKELAVQWLVRYGEDGTDED